jgi:hypothetical protein
MNPKEQSSTPAKDAPERVTTITQRFLDEMKANQVESSVPQPEQMVKRQGPIKFCEKNICEVKEALSAMKERMEGGLPSFTPPIGIREIDRVQKILDAELISINNSINSIKWFDRALQQEKNRAGLWKALAIVLAIILGCIFYLHFFPLHYTENPESSDYGA